MAIVRSQIDISSCASGMLGFSRQRIRSSGAPCFFSAARSTRAISSAVFLLSGCGEKMTASLHLIALMAMLTIVTSGLVTGSRPAITPDGLRVLDDAFARVALR